MCHSISKTASFYLTFSLSNVSRGQIYLDYAITRTISLSEVK